MQKKYLWILIAVVAVVVVGVAAFLIARVVSPMNGGGIGQKPVAIVAPPSTTREPVPANTVVPGTDSTGVPPDVAVPQSVKPSGGSASPYLRSFSLIIQNDTISPANVVARVGDIITLSFTSKDKAYDFVQPDYGLSWKVPENGTKTFQFQVDASGKFGFYCPSCGGPSKGPIGYIIAAPKQ